MTSPFRFHVFACEQRKADGLPSCSARGSAETIDALRRELATQGLLDVVQLTTTGSLGLCERGPNLVVYPDGVWYSGVRAADVPEIVAEHFGRGRPVERLINQDAAAVRQEIVTNRDRSLAALKARDAAGALPDEWNETVRGYQTSRIVLSAVELDVFSAVGRAGASARVERLALDTATSVRGLEILLDALVALGLLRKQAAVYANGPVAARYLCQGSADDARDALCHNLSLWQTWSGLSDCVRSGSARPREMSERGDDWTVPFIAAMHRNASLRAPLVAQVVGAERVRRLLDVGGGSGAYSIAFARANPALTAIVFDLATVVPIAEAHVAEAGLGARVHTRVGDLRQAAFGHGHDLVLLSAICHMLDPAENRSLLRRAFDALEPGGRVAIQDHVMRDDRTAPRAGALFAVNMLVGTARGGTFTLGEYRAWLEETGFREVQQLPLPGPNDLVLATRP
jgi:(2Fe-2S) ferredoxin/2-polyprenyl-3-methyl-5-hydroxy-6-metoxy-1,4-benzoquinol methylase